MDWEQLYQENDIGWDRGAISPALKHWLPTLKENKHQRILIPGCGYGHEVIELASQGYDVTGLDIAPSAIKQLDENLKKKNLSATTVCEDLFNYHPTQIFDAMYEQTCLCTIPSAKRKYYEHAVFNWLKQGGSLMILLMQTGTLSGPPFHVGLLSARQMFDESRWLWPDTPPVLIPRPKGGRFELSFILEKK
ncbi:MAG: methyltransferase domain-containing protein [Mariprofundaceae bacterium]|nr:methyltransferase domain-containing protein [Mariprofundaceae bacterium]